MDNLLWLDLETSGLSHHKNGILAIAAVQEHEHETKLFESKMQLMEQESWTRGALAVNGFEPAQIKEFPDNEEVFQEFLEYIADLFMGEPLVLAGYNIPFDFRFLEAWFDKKGEIDTFRTIFDYHTFDVYPIFCQYVKDNGIYVENKKLVTACAHFGIEFDAHDALSDIVATMMLYKKLTGNDPDKEKGDNDEYEGEGIS